MIINKVPQILDDRNMTATDLHVACMAKGLRLSWPPALKVATKNPLPPTISLGTVANVALALELSLGDIVEVVK